MTWPDLRRENEQLKQLVAELALKNRVLKKSVLGLENEWDKLMRYTQAEKMEIIRLVETSSTIDQRDAGRTGCAAQHLLSLVSALSGNGS